MDSNIIFMLQDAGVDTEGALGRFSDNSRFYERLLTKFLSDPTFQDMTNASKTEDTQTTLTSTHTSKGLIASPGFTRLYGISSEMMDYIGGDKFAEASREYNELKKAYDEIYGILSKA